MAAENSSEELPITEQENPRTRGLSGLPTAEVLRLMNEEDAGVAAAVGRVLVDVARAVDAIVGRLSKGGRLFYVGTGTSGRLGVLDASECPPTFGVPPELVTVAESDTLPPNVRCPGPLFCASSRSTDPTNAGDVVLKFATATIALPEPANSATHHLRAA